MKLASFEAVVRPLNEAGVQYLVAGGLAVNAHGYLRFTKDIDLVIRLAPDNVKRTFTALATLDYKPLAPISLEQFADPSIRESWIRDKGMQVLQLWSDEHPETPIDIFVREPFAFDEEYANALIKLLHGSYEVRFVSLLTLIRMMAATAGERDRIDIENLRMTLQDDGPTQSQGGEFDWRLTSFEGVRREQMRRWSELPLERMLIALDEMKDVAEQFGATQARERGADVV